MNPEVREKGRLVVTKTKKGFAGKVITEKGKEISLSAWEFKDDSLNDKECEIERPKGAVEKLYIDGREYPKRSSGGAPRQGGKGSDKKQPPYQPHHGGGGHGGRKPPGGGEYQDLWDTENTLLPTDTRGLIKNQKDIENYYLLLNKAAQLLEEGKDGKKFKLFVHERPRGEEKGKSLRVEPNDFKGVDFNAISKRSRFCRDSAEGYEVVEVGTLRPEWRLVVGLGGGNVHETSMTLHHVYGFPYIPGSAVKGVTRYFMIFTLLSGLFPNEDLSILDKAIDMVGLEEFRNDYRSGKADKARGGVKENLRLKRKVEADGKKSEIQIDPGSELIEKILDGWEELDRAREVFGNQSQRGKVIFLDAYPEKPPKIKVDIMNPHFSKYYMEKKPPVDSMMPVPVHFLTVEDTPFRFAVMAKKSERFVLELPVGGRKISEWVKAALTDHGIGAKTSVGYGYLTEATP